MLRLSGIGPEALSQDAMMHEMRADQTQLAEDLKMLWLVLLCCLSMALGLGK